MTESSTVKGLCSAATGYFDVFTIIKVWPHFDVVGSDKMQKVRSEVQRELMSVAEAEAMTGRSRWSWRRDCYDGRIASVKIGRRLFLPVAEIRRVIAEATRPRVSR
jgi:hypothetical protein